MVIYQILNSVNGHRYVGSAVNLKSRLYSHWSQLRRKVHHSPYLQRAFNKYGEGNFSVSVLENVRTVKSLLNENSSIWIYYLRNTIFASKLETLLARNTV